MSTTESVIRYPEVEVQLTGRDGNAFSVIGAVSKALRSHVSRAAADEFAAEAMRAGSYDDLLQLAMRTVSVS